MPAISLNSMLKQAQRATFFLLVFFISFQVGFHFWPSFTYISGVRIDYLSPTLYLLDIIVCFFILLSIPNFPKFKKYYIENRLFKVLFSLFILSLILNSFLAKSPQTHIFGIIKLIEFALLGFSISLFFRKRHVRFFVDALALSAVISSILAVWQFFQQSSAGGFWYFLGERTFNSLTIGISTVNLNEQMLRSYGSFPHPNVLAFFLLTAIVFIIFRLRFEKNVYEKIFLISSFMLSTTALFFTFSRSVILLAICFFIYAIYTKLKANIRLLVVSLVVVFALLYFVFSSQILSYQFLLRGFDFRQELYIQSYEILLKNPYFGIGLNNFFVHQAPLIKTISPIIYQPVHNIFVLALLSVGIFAFWIFPYLFVLAIRSLMNKIQIANYELRSFYGSVLFLIISIGIVGVFDHFFLTLEQGQIMLAIILGLSFAKLTD